MSALPKDDAEAAFHQDMAVLEEQARGALQRARDAGVITEDEACAISFLAGLGISGCPVPPPIPRDGPPF